MPLLETEEALIVLPILSHSVFYLLPLFVSNLRNLFFPDYSGILLLILDPLVKHLLPLDQLLPVFVAIHIVFGFRFNFTDPLDLVVLYPCLAFHFF